MFLTENYSVAADTNLGVDFNMEQLTEANMGFHIAYQRATMQAMSEEAQADLLNEEDETVKSNKAWETLKKWGRAIANAFAKASDLVKKWVSGFISKIRGLFKKKEKEIEQKIEAVEKSASKTVDITNQSATIDVTTYESVAKLQALPLLKGGLEEALGSGGRSAKGTGSKHEGVGGKLSKIEDLLGDKKKFKGLTFSVAQLRKENNAIERFISKELPRLEKEIDDWNKKVEDSVKTLETAEPAKPPQRRDFGNWGVGERAEKSSPAKSNSDSVSPEEVKKIITAYRVRGQHMMHTLQYISKCAAAASEAIFSIMGVVIEHGSKGTQVSVSEDADTEDDSADDGDDENLDEDSLPFWLQ